MPLQLIQQIYAAPLHISARLPEQQSLVDALQGSVIELAPGHQLVRAAWNAASIWPDRVGKTYRFGPPTALMGPGGGYPFHWIYTADETLTATWEAQLCANDVTRPGTFYFQKGAENALIATFEFGTTIRLLDLTGITASKLEFSTSYVVLTMNGANGLERGSMTLSAAAVVRYMDSDILRVAAPVIMHMPSLHA